MVKYNILKPWKTLEPWQKEVLNTKGNICLRSGRQVGKSTVISIFAGDYAMNNPNQEIMIIAKVERQAQHLFRKVLNYLHGKYGKVTKGRPTLSFVELENGSKIHCLPAGLDGEGIRGFTIHLLIADEAAFINELVWTAVTPMMAITKGNMILLSTPHGKSGYFYRCFDDPSYTSFHISAEDCPRKDEERLKREKERMTKAEYAQEYLGEFVTDILQLFKDEEIARACILKRPKEIREMRKYFLGVDMSGRGRDETTFEILDGTKRINLEQVESIVKTDVAQTETYRKIKSLKRRYNMGRKSIGVDDGGIGVGVYDWCQEDNELRRCVMGLNNSSKSKGRVIEGRRRILKEDMYMNLKGLMERDQIKLLKDDEVAASLKSVQIERIEGGKVKIYGDYTHIVEGLVRAAWMATKEKSLSILPYC